MEHLGRNELETRSPHQELALFDVSVAAEGEPAALLGHREQTCGAVFTPPPGGVEDRTFACCVFKDWGF